MYADDAEKINKIKEKFGNNSYAACMYVAKKARKLQEESYNVISESEAVEWAISDKRPDNLDEKIKIKQEKEKDEIQPTDRLNSVLDSIEQENIRIAVMNSYKLSIKFKRLVYDYNNIEDKYLRAKIRILTKMAYIQ